MEKISFKKGFQEFSRRLNEEDVSKNALSFCSLNEAKA